METSTAAIEQDPAITAAIVDPKKDDMLFLFAQPWAGSQATGVPDPKVRPPASLNNTLLQTRCRVKHGHAR
jgi:hypothetical protein